ncbi:5'-nucleotidase C-terminal domain-containing protein [bacterium]|nr:5'-nucleotidase C-terminal domain-containing protein [bacterium]
MKVRLLLLTITGLLLLFFISCEKPYEFSAGKISGVNSIQDLDSQAVFSFAIMSDNKGDSPSSSESFARMADWIKESNDKFVIGLGDHVKKGWENSFLEFIEQDAWWKANFYPNIADGENEYYGESQGDWGAGAPLMGLFNMDQRPNVKIRENGCEYYAKIKTNGYTIHLVQVHYPDEPQLVKIAFPEDTRNYLAETIKKIRKGKKDIIIAAAHSRYGFWIDQMNKENRNIILEKCDLILSATTHFFERKQILEFKDKEPLLINTGSISNPNMYCPPGYVQVHVMKKPLSLVVQYINAGRPERELQHSEFAYLKVVDGDVLNTDFRPIRPDEDMNRIVGSLPQGLPKDDMDLVVQRIYRNATGADVAIVTSARGLDSGLLQFRQLYSVFPYNNELCVVTLTKDEVLKIFKSEYPIAKDPIRIALSNFQADILIDEFGIPEDKVERTGLKEIPLLEQWLSSFDVEEFLNSRN